MSKALPATCLSGVVTVEGVPVSATILSEGVGSSNGVAVLDEDQAYYISDTTPDLKTTLDKIVLALAQTKTALEKVVSSLTLIDAKPTGGAGSGSTPVAATDIAAITTAAGQIETQRLALNTLKGALK